MRISHLFGCALLALERLAAGGYQRCAGQMRTTAERPARQPETGKLLGQMLGNEKLSNAIAQVEGGCAQLNGEELAANANATEQGAAIDEKVQAVTQAKDAVLGLGKMFGK